MMLRVLLLLPLLLCACNLSGAAPTTEPTPTVDTAQDGGLPTVGVVGIEPSGAGECVLTAASDTTVFSEANPAAEPMALLLSGYSVITYEQDASGWYAINFSVDGQDQSGWVNNTAVSTAGLCETIAPPDVCSVRPTFVVNIYREPSEDAEIIDVMGPDVRAALISTSENGWFEVDLGNGQTGWIAPDEGELVGC